MLLAGGSVASSIEAVVAPLNIGVTFFFVLSAFLLYRPFVARAWSAPSAGTGGSTADSCRAADLNAEGTCAEISYLCGITPTWSLGVKVAFYTMLPLFVIGLARLGRIRRIGSWLVPELAAIAVLAAVSLPIQRTLPETGWMHALNVSPIGWFALGLGLASVSVWVEERPYEPDG